ncbi:glycosyltransferase family 2 protein [Flavobacteriaceae bacterium]|nr:glycosyltransferase family 2 protein [Flavobacteriaceae bacterium]
MLITIFTPLFNRARYLERIYQSILNQNDLEIEWIIVDDGSNDHPKTVIDPWINDANFKIIYQYQNNQGKHVAINKGVELASGVFFFILDSDDYLPTNALKRTRAKTDLISSIDSYAGVCGRIQYINGTIVGSKFQGDIYSNSLDIRFNHKIKGDLMEVFKTEILKNNSFPVFDKERFCPEALVWNRIAQNYNLLFFDESIYVCEYLEGGLTSNIAKLRMESPKASMLYYSELFKASIPFVQKIKALLNFWRFSFNSPQSLVLKYKYVNTIWSILIIPFGYVLFLRDLILIKR